MKTKTKPTKEILVYYNLLVKRREEAIGGMFFKESRYKPLVAANSGVKIGIDIALEELNKIYKLSSHKN